MVPVPPAASIGEKPCLIDRMLRGDMTSAPYTRPKRRSGRWVALFAVVLAAWPASAAALTTVPPLWSQPQNLNSPSVFVDNPDVVFAADGRALATWREGGAPVRNAPEPQDAWRIAVRDPGALLFGPERAAPNFATPLVPYS